MCKKVLLCILSCICLALMLSSCAAWWEENEIRPDPGINNEEVMRIVLDFANDFKHDRHMHLEDSTVYYGNHGNYIDKIRLKFITQNILEMNEARELLVDMTEGFLERLNQDPLVGPLISSYPVNAENLEIYICFESYHVRYVDKRYIAWVVLEEGLAYYYAGTLTNEFDIWDMDSESWHQRVEPYYKSAQIVAINREAERMYRERHPKPTSLFAGDRLLEEDKRNNRTVGTSF